ncbi:MAG: chromate transporter [Spirochaetes bacterium]|nr:chromate transporter [Spirochaetota bacterium]
MEILTLAWTFFKIGVISFGGGWTIVGIIKREVLVRGWLSEQTFSDVVAIAQVTPGPVALNAATLVGFRVSGLVGAITASLSVVAFPMMALALVTVLIRRTGLLHADRPHPDDPRIGRGRSGHHGTRRLRRGAGSHRRGAISGGYGVPVIERRGARP